MFLVRLHHYLRLIRMDNPVGSLLPGDAQPSSRDIAKLQAVPVPLLAKLLSKPETARIVVPPKGFVVAIDSVVRS